MKKYSKSLILISCIMVFLMINMLVFADTLIQTIQVTFNSINIKVNNQLVTSDNILYNGTTYVPLRVISEMLDKDVVWEAETKTANINNKADAIVKLEYDVGTYIGQIKNNSKEGFGVFYFSNNEKYVGEWKNNKPNGQGTMYLELGKYIGDFYNGELHGIGTFYSSNGEIIYSGKWENSKPVSSTNNTPIQSTNPSTPNTTVSIKNVTDLENYIIQNYSTVVTPKGNFTMSVEVHENTIRLLPYNYKIELYNNDLFYELQYGTKYTKEERQVINKALREHQEKLGKDIIKLMPDKKITGSYFTSGYKYPTIKVDYWSKHWHTWQSYKIYSNFEDDSIVGFIWNNDFDEVIK